MNILCSVMTPYFLRMAKSIGIMFASGAKKNPIVLLSMRGTHQKCMCFVKSPRIMFILWPIFFKGNVTDVFSL